MVKETNVRKSAEAVELAAKLKALVSNADTKCDEAIYITLPRIILDLQKFNDDTVELTNTYITDYVTRYRAELLAASARDDEEARLASRIRERAARDLEAELDRLDKEDAEAPTQSESGAAPAAGAARPLPTPAAAAAPAPAKKSPPTFYPAMPAVHAVASRSPHEFQRLANALAEFSVSAIDAIRAISLYAQLQVPAMSDGANFGVEVLSELIEELAGVQEYLTGIMTDCTSVYTARGTLVATLCASPTSADLIEALVRLDQQQYNSFAMVFRETLRKLRSLRDTLLKNVSRLNPDKPVSDALY